MKDLLISEFHGYKRESNSFKTVPNPSAKVIAQKDIYIHYL